MMDWGKAEEKGDRYKMGINLKKKLGIHSHQLSSKYVYAYLRIHIGLSCLGFVMRTSSYFTIFTKFTNIY